MRCEGNCLVGALLIGAVTLPAAYVAAQQSVPATSLAGTYANDQLILELRSTAKGFTGHVLLMGNKLPVTAKAVSAKAIQGTYTFSGQQFPFQAVVEHDVMTLTSEGATYRLRRKSASRAESEEPSVSKTTGHGDQIVEKDVGVRFRVPKGWIAKKTEMGYLLGSNTEKGFLLVSSHELPSIEQLRAEAQAGLTDENGTALQLSGEVVPFGKNGLAAEYRGAVEWQPARAYAIGLLSPHGGGVTVLAAVEEASYSGKYRRLAETVATSVEFFEPQVSPVAEEWKQRLSNARLTYLWSYYSDSGVDGSYAGGSQETVIDLCGQGYFRYSDRNETAVDGGYGTGYNAGGFASGKDRGQGTWEVATRGAQALLRLKFHDGRVFEYVLSLREGKTYLDHKRYFRTYRNAPVAEHRPNCW